MPKLRDIQIRDPFVLLHEGVYYLYGSTDKDIWRIGTGFDVYRSTDGLLAFEGPFPAFRPSADFWSEKCFWAPEVHIVNGIFYMFATFLPKEGRRGTAVLKADNPLGPFLPVTGAPLTPPEWECLDGTLWMEDETPYMVFCHEWQQAGDGEILAMPLSRELNAPAEKPVLLFKASEAKWAKLHKGRLSDGFVTDGPFLYRAKDGSLLMLWSSFDERGKYAIGVARSESGRLHGSWVQEEKPLYSEDGGHGMLFRDRDGGLWLSIHSPNNTPEERPLFLGLTEAEGRLALSGKTIL